MANRRLAALDLEPRLKSLLASRSLVYNRDVAAKSPLELMELLDLDYRQCQALVTAIASQIIDRPKTALTLLDEWNSGGLSAKLSLSSHHPSLTLVPGLTEIVGPAGLGKTQTCLTLLTLASLDDGAVIYIDTESTFSVTRVYEIATRRFPAIYQSKAHVEALLTRIHVINAASTQSLLAQLQSIEEAIIGKNVRLLILDGIAAPVRQEFDRSKMTERQEFLAKIASILKFLSEEFHLPCLVTNQITTRFSAQGQSFQAALGISWAHAVNTRWIVEEGREKGTRLLTIGKSPMFRQSSFEFVVSEAGIIIKEEVDDSQSFDVNNMAIRKNPNAGGETMNVSEGQPMDTVTSGALYVAVDDRYDDEDDMFD